MALSADTEIVSFDIYFVPRDRPFTESLDAIEEAAIATEYATLGDADREQWGAIVDALAETWPGAEQHEGSGHREMSDLERGAQLSMAPGELALSVAYWHSGDGAQDVDRWLREVVATIEGVTGLVGYDPQADAAFLDGDQGSAAATMDYVSERIAAIASPPRKGWLRRFLDRG
ncbi:MAG: hypothetical protein ACR2P0_13600 [Acidimicrobiales bacterium]